MPAVCLLLVLGTAESAAQGTTALFFQSQAGDYIGAGQTRTYAAADGTFTIGSTARAVTGRVVGPSFSFWWDFSFSAPAGAVLVPGVYETARRDPFTAFNGLDFSGSGRGCNTLTGRFVVLEAEYGSGGTVLKFAADFEQHCDDADAALYGAIRVNSTIGSLAPFGGAYPDYSLSVTPPANGSISSNGAIACGTAGATCAQTFGAAATVALTAAPDAGYIFAGWTGDCRGGVATTVHVNGPKRCGARFEPLVTTDPRTLLVFDSRPGDAAGRGTPQVYSPANSTLRVDLTSNARALTFSLVSVDATRDANWTITMSAAHLAPLAVGTYEGALTYAGQQPSLQVNFCSNAFGRFVIRELVVGSNNTVVRAAVDLEEHCGNADGGFFAALRYNSTIVDPVPFEGSYPLYRLSLAAPANGTISGGALNCGSAGAACDFAPAAPASVTLTATPDPGYVFAGWTGGACVGGATLTVRVNTIKTCSAVFEPLATAGPRTMALLDYMADARGTATPAASEAFSRQNTDWTAVLWDRRTLEFSIYFLEADGLSRLRRLVFNAPQGEVLTTGVSYSATRYPFSTVTPGMEAGQSCGQFTGRFIVRDLDAAPTGEVQHAAVDFELHCGEADPAIFGTVRFNSPLDARPFDGDYPRYRMIVPSPAHGRVTGAGLDCGGTANACQADFTLPATVSVTATPDPGYLFAGWTGACHGGEAISLRVNTVRSCGPLFEPLGRPGERALLRMVSQPGESVLQGRTEVYSLANSAWTVSADSLAAVSFSVTGRVDGQETAWFVTFRARSGETLLPGTYVNVTSSGSAQPNMSVTGNSRSCTVGGASFTVRRFARDSHGKVADAAIDFEQHCSSSASPALAGTIEYTGPADPSRLSLDKAALFFTSTSAGNNIGVTSASQTLRVLNTGLVASWTVSSSQPWLRVTPTSSGGSGTLTVSVVPSGLTGVGLHTGTLTVTAGGVTLPPVTVSWTLLPEDGSPPFGSFDTPIAATRDVTGAIALTGWALDDVGVTAVQIWRQAHPADPAAAIFHGADARNGRIFVGDATLVDGARPDVETAYAMPNRSRAGWGYMMLTRGLIWDGEGFFSVHAIATDRDGHLTEIGSTVFSVNNALATKPFGTIDGPGQGATVSGLLSPNTGWVLTPNAGATIPATGVQVAVDGVLLNQVLTTSPRADITARFPQFDTTQAGRGVFIDTTAFTDGVHTIAWLVTDSTGQVDGVGSRFFRVANGVSSIAAVRVDGGAAAMVAGGGVRARHGWDQSAPLADLPPVDGVFTIDSHELERVEIEFDAGDEAVVYQGHAMVLGERRPLPAGSVLDAHTGVFTWQPGPGFLGAYELVITAVARDRAVVEWPVRIVLAPASAVR